MFWLFIILMVGVLVVSCIDMFNKFDDNTKGLKEIKGYYDKIENGMSLQEVNSLLGGVGNLVSIKNGLSTYKWIIGDGLMGKEYLKSNEISKVVPLSEYLKDMNKYYLLKDKAFIEIVLDNDSVCNKSAIGLI